eukprot:TRINITY_DN25819_c0_g1_i1.p1 TRINITY_DN25819_c0_g1~~TRINITY_DN25819_c0_g1_i1.p1  ORF type:complete len:159 (+),score=13.68 TRINITY_DN25819_c0_g1_i1:49-525(+)
MRVVYSVLLLCLYVTIVMSCTEINAKAAIHNHPELQECLDRGSLPTDIQFKEILTNDTSSWCPVGNVWTWTLAMNGNQIYASAIVDCECRILNPYCFSTSKISEKRGLEAGAQHQDQCGSKVCGAGQRCCSPTCSICGPIASGLCPAIVCHPIDAPQN